MSFEEAINFIFKWEGGLSDHPDDPGGITKYGISIRFAGSIGLDINDDDRTTAADIRNLSRSRAKLIYKEHFWQEAHCNELPSGLAFANLDAAVNMGVRRATMFLQMAVGTRSDGIYGPNTRAAVQRADADDALWHMIFRRNYFYGRLNKFDTFGKGWLRRSAQCHHEALKASR